MKNGGACQCGGVDDGAEKIGLGFWVVGREEGGSAVSHREKVTTGNPMLLIARTRKQITEGHRPNEMTEHGI